MSRFQRGGHVGAFAHNGDVVFHQRPGIVFIDLVLGRRGKGDITGNSPGTFARVVFTAPFFCVFRDTTAATGLEIDEIGELLFVAAFRVVDKAVGIGKGHHAAAQLYGFFDGVLRHVARTGHRADLAFEILSAVLQDFGREVDVAVSRGFGADQTASEGESLARDRPCEFVFDSLVLAEQVADLALAHADVPRRNVDILADVARQLGHERLAEAHDLVVALASRIEVGPALGAAHGEARQRVLQGLFEAEKLEDAERDRGVKAQSTLVGADGIVELHPCATIDANIAGVVLPADPEDDDSIGFGHALKNMRFLVLGVFFHEGQDGLGHFVDGLVKFFLSGVTAHKPGHKGVEVGLGGSVLGHDGCPFGPSSHMPLPRVRKLEVSLLGGGSWFRGSRHRTGRAMV